MALMAPWWPFYHIECVCVCFEVIGRHFIAVEFYFYFAFFLSFVVLFLFSVFARFFFFFALLGTLNASNAYSPFAGCTTGILVLLFLVAFLGIYFHGLLVAYFAGHRHIHLTLRCRVLRQEGVVGDWGPAGCCRDCPTIAAVFGESSQRDGQS